MPEVKLCLFCINFCFWPGERTHDEYYGRARTDENDEPEMYCAKGYWIPPDLLYEGSKKDLIRLMSDAKRCADYEEAE